MFSSSSWSSYILNSTIGFHCTDVFRYSLSPVEVAEEEEVVNVPEDHRSASNNVEEGRVSARLVARPD